MTLAAVSSAAPATGSSRGRMGAGGGRIGGDSHAQRIQRQHCGLLGAAEYTGAGPGITLDISYFRVSGRAGQGPKLRVRSTRIRPESGDAPPRFVIDFPGTAATQADLSTAGSAKVQVSQGQVQNLVVQTNDASGGWQVFFDLAGAGDKRANCGCTCNPGRSRRAKPGFTIIKNRIEQLA
jgi:hypothetical protein